MRSEDGRPKTEDGAEGFPPAPPGGAGGPLFPVFRLLSSVFFSLAGCAIAPDPAAAKLELARGEELLTARRRDEAREAFDRAARLDPGDPDLHARVGRLIAEDGDPAGGEPHVTRAMELAPARADLVALRAWIRGCLMDYQGTIDDCDVALRMDPAPYWVWENRAWAKEILGDREGAAADVREALRRAPPESPRAAGLRELLRRLTE